MKNKIVMKNIDLIVYDFDGVMTDNRILFFQDGTEAVMVNRADGLGINMIKELAIPQLILSTETNSVVSARAKKIGLPVLQGIGNKKKTLTEYCIQHNYDMKRVIYLGNDVNDYEVMSVVGFPLAPSDAHVKILNLAKIVLKAKGGEGVIREFADYLNGQ